MVISSKLSSILCCDTDSSFQLPCIILTCAITTSASSSQSSEGPGWHRCIVGILGWYSQKGTKVTSNQVKRRPKNRLAYNKGYGLSQLSFCVFWSKIGEKGPWPKKEALAKKGDLGQKGDSNLPKGPQGPGGPLWEQCILHVL